MLADGFHAVPPGRVAAIVTHLEMRSPPPPRAKGLPDGASVRRVEQPDVAWYRDLFSRVGARDWLWFSRLKMGEAELSAILHDPEVEVWALERDGRAEGLLELDFRPGDEPELAFLGLTQAMQGAGVGGALMDHAIARAFARPIRCFTIHTCTFDSPVALPFYIRSGFVPVRREVEIVADPRLDGSIPETSAAHHPIIRG